MTPKQQILEEFDRRFPLPKILALSGGKGVERDLMIDFLSTSIDTLLEEVIKCIPYELTTDGHERDEWREDTIKAIKNTFEV